MEPTEAIDAETAAGGSAKLTSARSTIGDVRVKGEPVANKNAKK
ncbi:hypothetical protein X731_12725 [Mesorhizobium sp. L2C054A000]|nr:hypothetical protein X731_12725 [Mesorhizobium sp. L2C054A000]